jgi:iron(III) transport system substrate-binding protein
MKLVVSLVCLVVVVVVILAIAGVLSPAEGALRVYVAVDNVHSRPILEAFEKETGIKLDVTYDKESDKTVGHVTRIIAEQRGGTPRCDVFWNNEIIHTLRLKQMGMTQAYTSPNAAEIPALFKDPEGHWTGFAARARILIVNTEQIPDESKRPTSFRDFLAPEWSEKCTIARPQTGTTLTHFGALFNEGLLGTDGAKTFLAAVRGNKVVMAASNGQTMRQTRDGILAFGFTDTDDFNHALEAGAPVVAVYPDQGEEQLGTMVIPNTVCILKDAPHLEKAKKLVDYLLSKEVEKKLAFGLSRQIPVRPDVEHPPETKVPGKHFRAMEVDWETAARELEARQKIIEEVLHLLD